MRVSIAGITGLAPSSTGPLSRLHYGDLIHQYAERASRVLKTLYPMSARSPRNFDVLNRAKLLLERGWGPKSGCNARKGKQETPSACA